MDSRRRCGIARMAAEGAVTKKMWWQCGLRIASPAEIWWQRWDATTGGDSIDGKLRGGAETTTNLPNDVETSQAKR